jgi:hypothetical protein
MVRRTAQDWHLLAMQPAVPPSIVPSAMEDRCHTGEGLE